MKECVVVVTGSRQCKDYATVELAIEQGIAALGIKPTKIIHGDSNGVEKLSGEYARKNGINCEKHPPKWKDIKGVDPSYIKQNKFGKYNSRAAILRDDKLIEQADALIAITLGTYDCDSIIRKAKKADLKIYEYLPEDTDHDYGYVF